jgi:hypothetical protein
MTVRKGMRRLAAAALAFSSTVRPSNSETGQGSLKARFFGGWAVDDGALFCVVKIITPHFSKLTDH